MIQQVTFPWPPKELSPNARVHWSKKARVAKSYRKACWVLALAAKLTVPAEGAIRLDIYFHTPDNRRRDRDNLLASVKSALDGLADALRVNDSRFHPWACLSEPEKNGAVQVVLNPP